MRLIVFLILAVFSLSFADNVVYKNGCVLVNVKTEKIEGAVRCTYQNGKVLTVKDRLIKEVQSVPFDPNQPTTLTGCGSPSDRDHRPPTTIKLHYDRLMLGVVSLVQAYDYYQGIEYSDKFAWRAGLWAALAGISFFYSYDYENVQVSASPAGVSLSVAIR